MVSERPCWPARIDGGIRCANAPGPDYPHQFVNTSDAPLEYLGIGTREAPEVCGYPGSDKVAALRSGLDHLQRRSEALDDRDGES